MRTKRFLGVVLSAVMCLSYIPSFTLIAGAAEVGACTTDSCTGIYTNGFCSVDSTHYEAAQQVSETHHPELSSTHNGYYAIENAGQLYWFANEVNSNNKVSINAILTDNINANPGYTFTFIHDTGLVEVKKDSTVIAYIGTGSMGDTSGENTKFDLNVSVAGTLYDATYATAATELLNGLRTWTPIAPSSNYMGTFDGGEYAVSGLYVNGNTGEYSGLFGKVFTGKVQNVGVVNSYFLGRYAGGIAGFVASMATSETITNCYNSAIVNGNERIGGIVGDSRGTIITYCYNDGVVNAYGQIGEVGGIVGCCEMRGKIENCYNNGRITANDDGTTDNRSEVGGIAGFTNGPMTNCYNTGAVSVTTINDSSVLALGGVLGQTSGTIANCYNIGAVSATGPANLKVGGVVGTNESSGTITNCYYLDTSYSGGAIGEYLGTVDALTGGKTAAQFASGEVCYLLGDAFGQTINTDDYPILGDDKVYKYTDGYSNELKFGFVDYTADGAIINIPTAGTYSLIFADYDGERLNDIDIVTVTVTEETIGEITKASEKGVTLGTNDKIMLWQNMKNLVPMCEAYIIK